LKTQQYDRHEDTIEYKAKTWAEIDNNVPNLRKE